MPLQDRATMWDLSATFPADDIEDLRAAGLLQAIVPAHLGGLGLGTEPDGALGALALLRLLGRANLALGRLVEAHINALRLVFRLADPALQQRVAQDAKDGKLVGLWVTDPPGDGLRISADGMLNGHKQFCSGAGHIDAAVVTALDEAGGARLVYVPIGTGLTASPLTGGLSGMRAATTGQVAFDSAAGTVFGKPDDYLAEPDFSCGAWRTSAVTLGGLEALSQQLRSQLVSRHRHGDPHQQARVGQAMIATETARLWMAEAAVQAESEPNDIPAAISYVGQARLAVERACLEVMELSQRSLGVAAFLRSNPVERICRDLSTYLRQPAADMVLTEAAIFGMENIPR
ncbi:acyl-CoA dehydrogenase family protein [Acidisphaera sp. L21]|uniref:acyl-CoA dehydrogenase family protein n=1 Tax=Acidisphaera sp. L21 TaxID=1641851 RepID=UPI0020B14119|nr:acyl-CoA dehydrogenase family protein [Acidisphaera sp. L21]